MSEKKKDERLIELMTEFLDTKEVDQFEPHEGYGHPGLDNKKMLDAIEGHRNEIETLKKQLFVIQEKLIQQQAIADEVQPIVVPEINALQTAISKHNTQIGDLFYQQKMLKTDVEEEKKREKKGSGFGNLGWLLLVSNILLWSLVAFFFYKNGQSSRNQQGSGAYSTTGNTNKKAHKQSSAAINASKDSIMPRAQVLGTADSVATEAQLTQKGKINDSPEPIEKEAKVNPRRVGGVRPVVAPVKTSSATSNNSDTRAPKQVAENKATPKPVKKQQASIQKNNVVQDVKKTTSTTNNGSSSSPQTDLNITTPSKEATNKQNVSTGKKDAELSQPSTTDDEPDVFFGD